MFSTCLDCNLYTYTSIYTKLTTHTLFNVWNKCVVVVVVVIMEITIRLRNSQVYLHESI